MSPWELGLTPGTNSFFVWVPFPGSVYLIVAEWLPAGPGLCLIHSQKCKEAHFKPASYDLPGKKANLRLSPFPISNQNVLIRSSYSLKWCLG